MKTAKWNLICRMNTIKWYYTTSHKFYEKNTKISVQIFASVRLP